MGASRLLFCTKSSGVLFPVFCSVLIMSSCNQQQFYEKEYLDPAGKKLPSEVGQVVPGSTQSSDILNSGESLVPGDGNIAETNNSNPLDLSSDGNNAGSTDSGAGSTTGTGGSNTGGGTASNTGSGTGSDNTAPLCNGGLGYKPTKDNFVQNSAVEGKVDILWVIDNSGSMGDEQEALAKNFEIFIQEFIAKKIDFKMAITTTDGTKNKNGNIVGNSDQLLTAAKAQENQAQFIADFKRIINVGTSGSGTEMGLHTASSFMSKNGANFLRSDAFLIIVVLSDEEEQGPKTVEEYVNVYKALKANSGMVKVYSIVNNKPTGNKWETEGTRYVKASNLTAGHVSSIKDDFYVTLRDMGGKIVDLLDSFPLASNPVNNDIKVEVDGMNIQNGWNFDSSSRTIKFSSEAVPDEGSDISVLYNIQC